MKEIPPRPLKVYKFSLSWGYDVYAKVSLYAGVKKIGKETCKTSLNSFAAKFQTTFVVCFCVVFFLFLF